MKKIFQILILFVLIITPICIQSSGLQNYMRFRKIDYREGFHHNYVRIIFQSSKGLIWFGTNNGLIRYNGYEYKSFINNPDDPDSISFRAIFSIAEDGENNLWIGTSTSLDLLMLITLNLFTIKEIMVITE